MARRKNEKIEVMDPADPIEMEIRTEGAAPFATASFVDHLLQLSEEPHRRKGERTRFRLKIATVAILEANGYHGLSMKDVTDEAGLSEGVIYNYFKDKRDLVLELLYEFLQFMFDYLMSVVPEGDTFGRIYTSNLAYIRFITANLGLWQSANRITDQLPELRENLYRHNHAWSVLVARGLQRRTGSSHPGIAVLTAHTLQAMLDEVLYEAYIRENPQLGTVAGQPEKLAELLSIYWYRLAYAANPKSDTLDADHPLLGLSLDESEES